jgi:adenosine deaminase
VLADLHRHLDGSLRQKTLEELASTTRVTLPSDLRFRAGMGLEQALSCFRTTVAVLQAPEALTRVASEICDDASVGNVSTLEIRFAPQLHGDIERSIDAVLEGCAGRAGVIVCALYGDPPDLVTALVRAAHDRRSVVGIDLAGAPSSGSRWSMRDYADAFRLARHLGLGRTVHASEGREPGEIRDAIEGLGAQRIGHATTLLDDDSIVALVIEREVTVEACITSNVHTGAIDSAAQHPLPRWLRRGIRACICTDNTLLSDVDSVAEHARALSIPGMTDRLLADAIAHGHAAAFKRD